MSQYDEETGFVLSDEDEIAREAALEDETAQEETDVPPVAEPAKQNTIVPRINKKLILLVAGGLASLIVIVSIIAPSGEKKKKDQGEGVASELTAPDFSVQQQPYEMPETRYTEVVQEENPVYVPPPEPVQRSQPAGGGGRAAPIDESALNAHGSAIIPVVQGRLLGQEAAYRGNTQGQDPLMQTISALGGLPMGQDEYTANRIAAIGGLGAPGGAGGSGGEAMGYREQNMQDDKVSFYSSGRKEEAT